MKKQFLWLTLIMGISLAGHGRAATTMTNTHPGGNYPANECPRNEDDPAVRNGEMSQVPSAYSSCVSCSETPGQNDGDPPVCPPPEPVPNPDDPCYQPGGESNFSLIDAPDSLITRGERLYLEAVYGAHGPILRWGRPIGFGPLGRLNYLAKAHMTRDRQFIRVCEPVESGIGVFERVGTTDEYRLADGADYGDDTRILLSDEENGVPATLRLLNPDGSSITMEFETDTEIVSDFDGYVYRITERRTRHGEASTVAYHEDRVVLTDHSGHEYVCLLENDRIVEIFFTVDGETRRWTYTYNDASGAGPGGHVTETNLQTGRTITTVLGDRIMVSNLEVKNPDGSKQSATYNSSNWYRNGSVEVHSRHVSESGEVITFTNSVRSRTYDGYGLVRMEVGVASIPDVTLYERNAQGHYTKKTDPLGREWERDFDGNRRLLRETFPDGGETRYEYDAAGDRVAKRIKVCEGEWLEFRYRYDDAHRLVAAVDPEGGERRYVYDESGLPTHELRRADAGRWVATAYRVDGNGQVTAVSHDYFITDPEQPDRGRPGDRLVVDYDPWGNQIRRTDALGNVRTYEWSPANKLTAKVDADGRRTEYTYNGMGQLTSQTDPLGNTTTWTYNTQLNLVKISGAAGSSGCGPCGGGAAGSGDEPGGRTWSTNSLLTYHQDGEGRQSSFAYDDRRRLISVYNPKQGLTQYAYDAADRVISVKDAADEYTYYEYDEVGRRVAVTDSNGHTTRTVYDVAGRRVAELGPDGGEIRYDYDGNSRLIAVRVRVDADTWRERRIRYDLRGGIVETVEAFGAPEAIVTRYLRDVSGRVVETVVDPDGLAITTRTEYDELGRPIITHDGNGHATVMEYDVSGNLIRLVSPEGRETAFEYDAKGRMLMSTLDPSGIGQFQAYVYDPAGNVLEVSDGETSVAQSYDRTNLLLSRVVAGMYTTQYSYDGNRNLTTITQPQRVNPMITTMTYDAMGRMLSIRYGDGQYWSYTYDGAGRLASSTNGGNQTRYEYDRAGRLTRVIQPLGNGPRYTYNLAGELVRSEGGPEGVQRIEYDAHGRVRAEYDGNGRARRYGYDSAGRLVRMTNEMGQTVSYGYDGAGNRVSLMDANLNVSTFEYDRDGNLVALRYPDVPGASANVERYEYDAAGRLAVKTTPNGAAVRFLYDMAGKPLAVYTGEAVATPEDVPGERLVVRYEYNGAGQVVREENRDALLTYAYDAFGRLSRVDYPNLGRWITYDYGLDRPTWVSVYDRSYSTSLSVYDYVLAYNASGEVASARNRGGAYYGHYAYDENGRRLQRTLGNGTVNSYEYDDNDRLKQLSITHDGEVLASFRYSHDGAGNRTGIEYGDGSRSVYEYDEAYRLIRDLRVDARGGTLYDESYAYDAVGNRLRKTRLGGRKPVDVAYAYNARNQLVSATGDEAGEYEYDRDGNLIRTAGPHGVETREYDVLGRLTGYAGPSGTERYTHIGADWKRQTAVYSPVDGEEEKYTFLYDGDNVLMDLMGDSLTLRNTYVTPFLDESLVMIRAGEGADHYYMSHDGLGSVRVVNNASGHLRNVYDYTAYGEPDPVSTFNGPIVTHQRYGYTGREHNMFGGRIHYRHREYFPRFGKFDRPDPSSYEANEFGNLYQYSANNPVIYSDPYGLDYLSCVNECLNAEEPFNRMWPIIVTSLTGGAIPKKLAAAIAQALGDERTAHLIRSSIKKGANRFTTLPSTLQLKLKTLGIGKGKTFLRTFGRAANGIWIVYGLYLAQIQIQCAAYCYCLDSYVPPGIVFKVDEMIGNAIGSFIDSFN